MADASERAWRKRSREPRQDEHSKRLFRNNHQGQSAWERHQLYVERYLRAYRGNEGESKLRLLRKDDRNDWDILKDRHRFLREVGQSIDRSSDDASPTAYEDQVAKKYYDNLFKDFVLADLKHFKSGDIGLRWRSEEDVIEGRGQFTCANVRCDHHERVREQVELTSYEVNFAYSEPAQTSGGSEEREKKNALVKVVLCDRCGKRMRYKRERERRREDRAQAGQSDAK